MKPWPGGTLLGYLVCENSIISPICLCLSIPIYPRLKCQFFRIVILDFPIYPLISSVTWIENIDAKKEVYCLAIRHIIKQWQCLIFWVISNYGAHFYKKKETQVAERSCTKIEYNLCMKQTSTERMICAIRMTKHTNNLLNLPPKNYHLCIEQHSKKTKVTFTQKEQCFYTRKNHHV